MSPSSPPGRDFDALAAFVDELRPLAADNNLNGIRAAIAGYAERLGFERFTYHVIQPPHGPRVPFYISTYPEEWVARYVSEGYVKLDPVVGLASRSLVAFPWQDAWRDRGNGRQRELRQESGDLGLRNGLTVPIHSPGGGLATLNFTASVGDKAFADIYRSSRHQLESLALHVHELVLQNFYPSPDALPSLAPRERECLLWASEGKSNWEVGQILGLSEETVRTYIKSAAKKLGATNRLQTVVKAIAFGLIVR
ncbi:MAG TPA: LuxR family transcriptional regulator [Alphaproteobacteria bacterium]|nr:LuxR family transcriptional regulator [Alphaproteobacteria bacterium]